MSFCAATGLTNPLVVPLPTVLLVRILIGPKRERPMSSKEKVIKVDLNSKPQGTLKALGGSERDEWNGRLSHLLAQALPVNQTNIDACREAATAALSGLVP